MATISTDVKARLSLVKGDVGLGNVDNTTDAGKPVSTAQATAIGLKQDTSTLSAAVRAVTLTGLSLATNQAIAAGDSILLALGYIQAQISALAVPATYILPSAVVLSNTTPVDLFTIPVLANSVYDLLVLAPHGVTTGSLGGMTREIVLPAGAEAAYEMGGDVLPVSDMSNFNELDSAAVDETSLLPLLVSYGSDYFAKFMVQTAGTAGNFIIRVTQDTPVTDTRTFPKGCYVIATRAGAIS